MSASKGPGSVPVRVCPPAPVVAAGALVWRIRQGRLQVVLVHRPRYRDWSWPKGKQEPGEHVTTTAIREVEEETGLPIVLGRPLPGLEYPLSDGRMKLVHYWAAQVAGRPESAALTARPPFARASANEIDRVRWMDAQTARQKVTRRDDIEPLDALIDADNRGRLDTRALVLVRHGRALGRASHDGTEATRPLTPAGVRQAAALEPLLSAFGVTEVVTSPWARCHATIAPYAKAAGVPVRELDALTEAAHTTHPTGTGSAIAELCTGNGDLAVCTHRPVLPTAFGVLRDRARQSIRGQFPTEEPWLRPGEALILHVGHCGPIDGGHPRIEAVERHQP